MASDPAVWVEVDTSAIRHNFEQIQKYVGSNTTVMPVLKTNAYGHGLEIVAKALRDQASYFGVSTLEEGIRLRQAGISAPVLVFHPAGAWNAFDIVANELTATVDSEDGAEALVQAGRALGVIPKVHLKIDTGMSRFGVPRGDTGHLQSLFVRDDLAWDGVYTHLATASDGNTIRAAAQLASFRLALSTLSQYRELPPRIHALNSAGLLRFREERHTMVRTGTLLFGQYPGSHLPRALNLQSTWRFRARILSMRNVQPGTHAGYGFEWTAKRPSVLATIGVGYYDGFSVEPMSVWKRSSGWKSVARRISGREALRVTTDKGPVPVVGRIAAQSTILDVTDIQGLRVGDIVDLPARRVLVGDHVPRIAVSG